MLPLGACLEQFRHTPPQSERGPRHQQTKAGQAGFTELRMSKQGKAPASTHHSSNTELATAQKRPQRRNRPAKTRVNRRTARGRCPQLACARGSRLAQWLPSYCNDNVAITGEVQKSKGLTKTCVDVSVLARLENRLVDSRITR